MEHQLECNGWEIAVLERAILARVRTNVKVPVGSVMEHLWDLVMTCPCWNALCTTCGTSMTAYTQSKNGPEKKNALCLNAVNGLSRLQEFAGCAGETGFAVAICDSPSVSICCIVDVQKFVCQHRFSNGLTFASPKCLSK